MGAAGEASRQRGPRTGATSQEQAFNSDDAPAELRGLSFRLNLYVNTVDILLRQPAFEFPKSALPMILQRP